MATVKVKVKIPEILNKAKTIRLILTNREWRKWEGSRMQTRMRKSSSSKVAN